jgi:hypothetical protein
MYGSQWRDRLPRFSPYRRPALLCQTMRQTAKPAHDAACCDNRRTVLTFSTAALPPTGRRYDSCIARFPNRSPGDPETVTLTALLWLLLPLLAVVALIDLATMSTERRVRLLRTAGLSQSAIAARLGCSRYRVRVALAVA